MNSAQQNLWNTYATVNEWVKFADAKAGAILAFNGVILGLIFTGLVKAEAFVLHRPTLSVLLIMSLVSLGVSTYFGYQCLKPRRYGEVSLIFFEHIAKVPRPTDYEALAREHFSNDEKMLADISHEIWFNSRIAAEKYSSVIWALRFLIAALAFEIIVLILILLSW